MESSGCDEIQEIVIVGGGLCGLATALALHRPMLTKIVIVAVMAIFFRNQSAHTQYDCGLL